ncbi:MAG: C4-dicarboxylate TRAP transporter substrate-binding protein [Proteobacteria bacterium]|nr:C4-dicarboxylate TRAP transporter substrate-binding protein [Pseudomonadota bacterium]
MKTPFKFVKSALVAVAFTAVSAGMSLAQAEAFKVTFSAGHGTQLSWIRMIKEFYMPEVDKRLLAAGGKHSIVWTEAFGGTLAKIGGELDAVESGIAEMGYVYTIFEAAKLPLLGVCFMAPFGSDDPRVVSKIITEMHDEMPEMADQWLKHKQIFIGAVSTDTDYILTTFPVNSLADLKGKKMGASGSLSLWAAGAGAVPVQGDFATHFNNIKTGVYDGLIAFTTGMYPAKLHQVAPTATRIDLGSMTIGALSINKAFYDKLPPDVQKVIKDVGREYTVKIADQLMTLAAGFEKKMVEEGAKFSKFPPEERKKWANTMPNIAKNWVEANEKRQVPAGKVLTVYMKKLRDNKVQLVRDWDKN